MKKFFILLFFVPFLFSFRFFNNGTDVFMGDSITFGNELGSQQYTARWSTQYCNDVPSNEVNDAQSGAAMTPGLNWGRPVFDINQVPGYDPATCRHIFVSYWVNDYLYGGTPAAYAASTSAAVDGIIAKGWPAEKIVLCFNYLPESPGTWIDMTDAKAQQWMAALRTVQQAKHTSFLDFYTLIYNRSDKASYSGDDIHPTAAWNTIMKAYAETNIEVPSTNPLPVSVINFSGQRQGNSTILKWTVAQEENVAQYEIERSENGANWTKIGTVNSLGNTGTSRSYSYTDNNFIASKQLYCVRTVDINGTFKLTNIVIINGTKPTAVSFGAIFPNPVQSKLNVVIESPAKDNVTLQLIDVSGRVMKSERETLETGANTIDVGVDNLPKGSYFLKLVSSNQNMQTAVSKFTKD